MSTIAFSSVKLYLGTISLVLSVGTLYSVVNSTYLDTSDPLLAHLAHPLQSTDYFANKANPLNTVFIKNAWGWTSGAFALLYATSSARTQSWNRLLQYVVATLAWLAFTSWFFGPPLIERVIVASGGQCVVVVPGSGEIIDVPFEHCYTRSPLSPATHPTLFASLTSDFTPPNPWSARPRLRKGHDVSGHIFLLTMSILFLADQLTHSWRSPTRWSLPHTLAVNANAALIAIWMLATCATALYFHTPLEKFSGFLLGVAAFGLTQLPPLSSPRAVTEPIPCKDD